MNPSSNGRPVSKCPASSGATPLYGAVLGRDPYRLYEHLRRRWGPIAPVEIAPGVGAWLVLGHQAVLELVWDERNFTSDARHWNAFGDVLLPMGSPLVPVLGHRPALSRLDGQEHRHQRQVVTQTLDLVDLRQLRTAVRQRADTLVDGWSVRGRADLISQYARPLVWGAFAQLLGRPDDPGSELISLVGHIVGATDEAVGAETELTDALGRLAADRRTVPGPDLPSWLVAHPARLTDDEVAHSLLTLLLSGTESTISWIGNTVRLLLRDPAVSAALATGRATVSEVVDRALWTGSPVPNIAGRWARADITFAGRPIRAGDLLIPCLAAANTDPLVVDADTSVNRAHLAWGTGAHGCPAKDAGRMMAETAVDVLLGRLTEIRSVVPDSSLPWRHSLWCGAPAGLPVAFTPQHPTAPAPRIAAALMPVPEKTWEDGAPDGAQQRWGWWNSMTGW